MTRTSKVRSKAERPTPEQRHESVSLRPHSFEEVIRRVFTPKAPPKKQEEVDGGDAPREQRR